MRRLILLVLGHRCCEPCEEQNLRPPRKGHGGKITGSPQPAAGWDSGNATGLRSC